ncbi:MAG: hypothetical protein RR572_05680, partial [Raoultibacter sp.]
DPPQSFLDSSAEKQTWSAALGGFVYDLEQILKVSIDASTTESLTHEFLNKIRNDEVLLYERPSKSD